MEAYAEYLTQSFSHEMDKIELDNAFLENLRPSQLHVSTISIIFKYNHLKNLCKMNFDEIVRHVMKQFDDLSVRERLGNVLSNKTYGLVMNGFGNSFTFEYHDERSSKSLKFFMNGQLQCSGLRKFEEASTIAKYAENIINILMDRDDIRIYDFKVSLMNAHVALNSGINNRTLYDVLYPSLLGNIKMSQKIHKRLSITFSDGDVNVTIMVFHTGKIIFAGARLPIQLSAAYTYVIQLIDKHFARIKDQLPIKTKSCGKRGRKKKDSTFEAFLHRTISNGVAK